jgi:hypothetical protein
MKKACYSPPFVFFCVSRSA